jgi:hypothetical protein
MVKIAMAGGAGSMFSSYHTDSEKAYVVVDVGQEFIDVLLAGKKHEILILTRKVNTTYRLPCLMLIHLQDVPTETTGSPVKWAKVDYDDVDGLTNQLQGIDVVLSFVAGIDQEQGFSSQKNLIDASVKAGVKRFAPSEWIS